MKKCIWFLLASGFLTITDCLLAQGTAFTYQGQLQNNGSPANGNYDFSFALFNNNSTIAGQVGGTLTILDVGVTNGLFTVTLDFGSVFTGNSTWLSIGVRTNGGSGFTALNPLQELTPAPYALYAPNAGTAATASSVPAANLTGTVPLAQLPGAVVTNGESGVTVSGSFSGNGAGVTNVDLMQINDHGAISWSSLGVFGFNATYSVPSPYFVLALTNFDGQGHQALVTANGSASSLSVLTNNGSGVFGSNATYSVGSSPFFAAAGDINHDGYPDLISANSAANTLTVLTNNGSGVFGFNATYSVGAGPRAVVLADVNHDGYPDLINANANGNSITVLTNNGSGGFGSNATYSVGAFPVSVVAADVNHDGWVDLIAGNLNDNTVTVLTNNGSGVFGFNATYGVSSPRAVIAADVNNDGQVDLVCGNESGTTVTVLINNGNGIFSVSGAYTVGSRPESLVAADVNHDGWLDLIVANNNNNTLTVLTNNGGGGFGVLSTLRVGLGPYSVAVVDVNRDGLVDLVTANTTGSTLTVLTNTPTGLAFTGNGSGLSGLNASQISTGTVPLAQLPGALVTNTETAVTLSGTFSGNGGGLTNLSAAQLTGFSQVTPPANGYPILNMVWIVPGTFVMGAPTNDPDYFFDQTQHLVTLTNGFWMGQHPVTQGEYLAVVGTNPSSFTGDLTRPVESVSWLNATNYCYLLAQREQSAARLPAGWVYRLPTESEWEYCCRAGTTTRFYFGNDPGDGNSLTNYAWYSANSPATTQPVGQLLPNAWGLVDMVGNVFEWCQDWYGTYPTANVSYNPQGPATGSSRVLRGDAWGGPASSCRSATRIEVDPRNQRSIYGFRVVLAPGQ